MCSLTGCVALTAVVHNESVSQLPQLAQSKELLTTSPVVELNEEIQAE
jgi:hypothetical protein